MNWLRTGTKMLTLEVAIIALFVVPAGIYAAATIGKTPLTNSANSLQLGLMGHWTFDGPNLLQNVVDSSGGGNSGRLIGFTSTTTEQGPVGQAITFDGTNDYISAPAFSWPSGGPVTVAFWVKSPGGSRGSAFNVDSGGTLSTTRLQAHVPWDDNILYWDYGDYSGSGRLSIPFTAYLRKWTHVVLVSAGNGGSFKGIYLNGVLVNSAASSDGPDVPLTGIQIGYWDADYHTGPMDDFRIYNRVLSATEVQKLYGLGATSHIAVATKSGLGEDDALVGHWTYDGPYMLRNVTDASSKGNNGYMSNFTSTSSAIVEGKLGQALTFDGVDSMVDTVNYSSVITASFTICSWGYWNSVSGFQKILHAQNGTPEVNLDIGTGGDAFQYYTAAVGSSNNSITSGTAIKINRWYHICGTYDNGAKVKTLYVDGAQVATGGTTVQIAWPSSALRIGRRLSAAEPLNGKLDDTRVYSRALAAAEVKRLYELGNTSHVAVTPSTGTASAAGSGLVGHWTFDGPRLLQNVADSSATGNNGTLSNVTSTSTAITEGRVGQGITINGTSQYVVTGNYTPPSSNFTVSIWAKPDNLHDFSPVFTQWNEGATKRSWALVLFSDGKLYAYSSQTGSLYWYHVTNATIPVNKWTHLSVVYGSSSMTIYVNGVAAGTTESGNQGSYAGIFATSQPVWIGYSPVFGAQADEYFAGTLDDARMYTRALSAEEVKRLYELGK